MSRSFSQLSILSLAAGCHRSMPEEVDPFVGDLNQDHVQDVDQSIGVGHDDRGEPVIYFFPGPQIPADDTNLWFIGYGCSVYDNDMSDDWVEPCVPLDTKVVDGQVVAYIFSNIREGVYEGVPYDANHDLFANLKDLETTGDTDFVVMHIDHQGCPNEQPGWHYAFKRVGDDILPVGESIAPPDTSCH